MWKLLREQASGQEQRGNKNKSFISVGEVSGLQMLNFTTRGQTLVSLRCLKSVTDIC